MKIGFFAPHFSIGGLEKTNLRLGDEFHKLGHEVELITFNHNDALLQSADFPIKLHDLRVKRTVFCIPALVRTLRTENYDVIISCQHYANIIIVLAKFLSFTSTKILACERISIKIALASEVGLKKILMPALLQFSYRFCDAIVANSKQNAEDIKNLAGLYKANPNIVSIYNPAFRPEIPFLARKTCSELKRVSDKIIFLSVGRLYPEKNISLLVSAFASVHGFNKNTFLVIVGEGPCMKDLKEQAFSLGVSDHIMFVGYQSNPYRFMSNADVLVLTSDYEGLPNVLIESQVLGLPIISTDCMTGPREILLDGRLGELIKVGSSDDLVKCMTTVSFDLDSIRYKANEAKRFLVRFDPEENAKAYLNLVGAPFET